MTNKTAYTDSALSDALKHFLTRFKNKRGNYIYVEAIDEMRSSDITYVVVDYVDLCDNPNLQKIFNEDPDRVIDIFPRAIKEALQIRFPDYAEQIKDEITVRISNYPLKKTVRDINSKSSGTFISIKAMLIRMSPAESIPIIAVYVCPDEHETKFVAKKNFIVGTPVTCSNSACTHREFELKQDVSKFEDYQILQLQELPKELPPGKLPKTLGVFVHGDLVDSARMGDTVEITGIVRAEMSNKIKLGKEVQTYRQRLYANNIMRLSNENDFGGETSENEIKLFKSIKEKTEEDATNLIVNSFATHIQGHEVIKEAMILTMIGSDAQILDDGTTVRGDINIFILGDPGTGKSELGKAAYRIAPRAFYTSGRGASAAGLTAATIQDKSTGAFMLEPGITVLADQGIAIIDEFDKMKPEDRSALHEVMEQQTVSIAKGGITATLNARASIMAIANPAGGRYDVHKDLTENIPSIPIPLLTRFDMIFVVRDVPSEEKDKKIARHILSTHKTTNTMRVRNSFESDVFAKYLRYVKKIKIKLSKGAENIILAYYLKQRKPEGEDAGYPITPRHMEGLIRITTARAKWLLKDAADENDAERAIYILEEMLKSSGTDPSTGKVDYGMASGSTKSQTSKIKLFQDIMKGLEGDTKTGIIEKEMVVEMINSEKWVEGDARDFIKRMIRDGVIFENVPGKYSMLPQ